MLNSACAVVDYQSGVRDADRDGVVNRDDKCAESKPAAIVDATGCDLFEGVVEGLVFETDSLDFSISATSALDELAVALLASPEVKLEVAAHTDNRGKASLNLELSKQRVMAVVGYLVSKGIGGSRLSPIGYGESRPLAPNESAEGRRLNRRIEIRRIDAE